MFLIELPRENSCKTLILMEEKEKKDSAPEIDYGEMIEQAPDPIVVLDNLGFIKYMNSTAELISGYRREELLGKHFAQTGVVAPASMPKAVKEFAQTMTGYPGAPYRLEMFRKDRKPIAVEINHKPIMREGKVVGVNLILRYVGYKTPDGRIESQD